MNKMVEQVKTKMEPYVRFRGFDDEWEEVKLGDVFSDGFSGGTPKSTNESYYNGDIPFLNISDMSNRVISSTEKFITSDGLNNSSARLAPKGTVSLAMYASVGKIGIMGKPMATSQAFYNMVFDNESVRDFIYTYLEKMDMMHGWDRWVSQGTQKNLNAGKIKNLKIKTPSSLDEQQKIGDLFQTLDKTIDLSNTHVENLKQQKKALLQRLFPQKGETEPKVRLRGFTDEWDSSLLLDEIEVYQPKSLPQSKFLDEGYPVYGANGMIGYYDEYNHENRQIAMACRGNTAGVVNIIPEQSYITGNAMIMDVYTNDKLDFNFMGQLFNNFDFTPYISGSGQPQITRSALKGAYIQLPSLEEQQAIGELFQTVDEQIRLAEDKVSQYKELKQALLQRLFVR